MPISSPSLEIVLIKMSTVVIQSVESASFHLYSVCAVAASLTFPRHGVVIFGLPRHLVPQKIKLIVESNAESYVGYLKAFICCSETKARNMI